MARPQSADHHLKRDEILSAAAACFAQYSYAAATMQQVAEKLGTSKARIYHYYESKDALLFDLLDRYTQRLLAIIGETEALAQRKKLDDRAALHALVEAFLLEYEHSAHTHVALLNDTKFLSASELIFQRQRDVVSAFTRFLRRAYPQRINELNQTPLTMMLLGMINWTFTWLRPGGPLSYAQFAKEVVLTLEQGFTA
jgi:AcrR family transcriptional regulator